jgi:hypothetical protein
VPYRESCHGQSGIESNPTNVPESRPAKQSARIPIKEPGR